MDVKESDTLFVRGLKVDAIIGVFDWERDVRQQLVFDVELNISMQAAGVSDDVADALSYVDVADEITRITQTLNAKLLEHLAEQISTALFNKWPITALRLRINKPTAVAQAEGVGVEIHRQRS